MKRFLNPYIYFLLVTSPLLQAEPLDSKLVRNLFDESSQATRNLNYEGNFVYLHDNNLESMKIVHFQTEGVEQEVLRSRSGGTWEILSIGDQVYVDLGANKQTDMRYNRVKNFSTRLSDDIFKYYRFNLLGTERVAERLANKIQILPKDKFRYGYNLWIDDQSKLILKTEVVDEHGKAIEVMMFTELNLEIKPPKNLKPVVPNTQDGGNKNVSSKSTFVLDFELPPGFATKENISSEGPYEHVRISDGFANISVFVKQQKSTVLGKSQSVRIGSTTALGVEKANINRQVTIIGEVPLRTVEQIANTIQMNVRK